MTQIGSAKMPTEGSEKSRLFHALLRLADDEAHWGRKSFSMPEERQAFLHRLLVEIDETVLPRQITVSSEAGPVTTLTVSNRRLVSLLLDHENQPAEQTPDDPATLALNYVKTLQSLTETGSKISISVSQLSHQKSSTGLSCSAHSLANAMGITDFGTSADTSLEDFIKETTNRASAWLKDEFCLDAPECQGAPEELILLQEAYQAAIGKGITFASGPQFGSRSPICVLLPAHGDRLVTILATQSTTFLALSSKNMRSDICENWHKVFAAMGRKS